MPMHVAKGSELVVCVVGAYHTINCCCDNQRSCLEVAGVVFQVLDRIPCKRKYGGVPALRLVQVVRKSPQQTLADTQKT